jgi:hypothetical protein
MIIGGNTKKLAYTLLVILLFVFLTLSFATCGGPR